MTKTIIQPVTWQNGIASANAQYKKYGSYDTPATARQMRRIIARDMAKQEKMNSRELLVSAPTLTPARGE